MWSNDVVAAISTPPGEGGISIVRISGAAAWDIARKVFRRKRGVFNPQPWRVYLGEAINAEGMRLDECLCSFFRAPKSFTGEDLVELSIHGGAFVAGRVLESLLDNGARLAYPGEFTKRAFLNGRLDLAQAEAVIDIIRSTSDIALRNAGQQLEGQLSREVEVVRALLLGVMAQIEASIDFPEHDIPQVTYSEMGKALQEAEAKVAELVETTRAGRVAKEGLKVVLVGRPNVGKSSLLNRLAGQERAIVTEYAGTTRDTVEVDLNIEGVLLSVVDTAGLRESDDVIENIGIARAEAAMVRADVLLVLIDSTVPLGDEDAALLERTAQKKRIVLLTKGDLPGHNHAPLDAITISTVTGKGLGELRTRLATVAKAAVGAEGSLLVTNVRHAEALREALITIRSALHSVSDNWSLDVVAVEVRASFERLGEISGETVSVDVADAIFSQFCIGK